MPIPTVNRLGCALFVTIPRINRPEKSSFNVGFRGFQARKRVLIGLWISVKTMPNLFGLLR